MMGLERSATVHIPSAIQEVCKGLRYKVEEDVELVFVEVHQP